MIWRDERCAALRLSVPGGHVEDCVCDDVAVRTMDNLEAVSFQPVYGDGKWRIFNRGGPFAGKEWDLSAETLWKAWDATE